MQPRALFIAAASSYTANCALGAAVAVRLIDTRRIRWVHHALYIATCTLAGAAALAALCPRRTDGGRRRPAAPAAAVALLPAAVPLFAIPRVGTHSSAHMKTALTAAPFFAGGLLLALRASGGR